jgi:glucuronoarabinoxylan endo-1,4-beta-xylanase
MYQLGRVMLPVAVLAVVMLAGPSPAATITLDPATRFQTVDGFGGTSSRIVPWSYRVGPFYVTINLDSIGFYDSIANDMQIYRTYIPPIQASEGAAYTSVDFKYEIALRQHGINRFFASVFSPPGWMKSNGSENNGGALLTQYYDDFANMCAEYARQFKAAVGVDLYGISLQNEPLFSEPYASCVYSNATYRDLLKVAGPVIRATVPGIKFVGAEDVLNSASRCNGWVQSIIGDAAAAPYWGIYAVHCHTELFDTPTDGYRDWWNTVRTVADVNSEPLWMTEVGDNFATDWATAVRLATTIGNSFKYGNCAAWVWLTVADASYAENSMVLNGVFGPKYYQMAHFGRFVKLNAQRISSSSSDVNLQEVAFRNTDGSVAVVVTNLSASTTVSLAGTGLPGQFNVYQSTDSLHMMRGLGAVRSDSAVTLPQNSITTFSSGIPNAVAPSQPVAGLPRVASGLLGNGRIAAGHAAALRYAIAPGESAALRIFGIDGAVVEELDLSPDPGVHTIAVTLSGSGCYVARLVRR